MDVDLSNVPNQIGTAILDSDGNLLKATGELDQNACATIFKILLDAAKCLERDSLRRLSISFQDHNYVVTIGDKHVYIVKVQS